jgi:hypothetical protein
MKPPIEPNSVTETLARELHRQYRAAAKAMGVNGPAAHDHGPRDCGGKSFKYFWKRARLILKRASCNSPETLGQAEENLSSMVLARRLAVGLDATTEKNVL